MSQAETAVPVVSRFEANLLEILRYFLSRAASPDRVRPMLMEPCDKPKCLSRAAVELVKSTLARGCVARLAHTSGWRRERHLRGARVAEGRLWERTEPAELGLKFSRHTLDFLIWLTAEKLSDTKLSWWTATSRKLTLGDQLLLYYAYGGLRKVGDIDPARRSVFVGNALCRLGYPGDFAAAAEDVAFSFEPWMAEAGPAILEALLPKLAGRWAKAERDKAKVPAWQKMQALGHSQGQVLESYLNAIDAAGRRDLARLLLMALWRLLPEGATAQRWLDGVKDRGPTIAQRLETARAALVVLQQFGRLRRWALEARGVAFFEENYVASQLCKTDWEAWQGEALHARAEAILREIEPL